MCFANVSLRVSRADTYPPFHVKFKKEAMAYPLVLDSRI